MEGILDTSGIVGFSIGNTNSMVAYCSNDGKTHVIANEEGDRAIPSILSFEGVEIFHGTEARKRLVTHPKNTFTNFVDNFFGIVVHGLVANESDSDAPSTVELMRHHILKLKECAENYIGQSVYGCVVSVPNAATELGKKHFIDLLKATGFRIVQLVNEATCCLFAYEGLQNLDNDLGLDVVIDLSGTRTTASLFKQSKGKCALLAAGSRDNLSGIVLDTILRDYLVGIFKKETNLASVEGKALIRLKQEAEAARITLSSSTKATVSVDSLFAGFDLHTNVTRLRLDMLFRGFYRELGEFLGEFMTQNQVALCGGIANTPKVATIVRGLFLNSKILAPAESYDVSAFTMEACARGAALQASLLLSLPSEDLDHYLDAEVKLHIPRRDVFFIIGKEENPVYLYGKATPIDGSVVREVGYTESKFEFCIVEGHWENITTSDDVTSESESEDEAAGMRFIAQTELLSGELNNLPVGQALSINLSLNKGSCYMDIFVGKQCLVNRVEL